MIKSTRYTICTFIILLLSISEISANIGVTVPLSEVEQPQSNNTETTKSSPERDALVIDASEEIAADTDEGEFSLRTNLLYWVTGSINVGFEWKPKGSSIGVLVNGGYAPLGGNHWEHNLGGWFISPELRLYLGHTKQWFLGANLLAGGYNFNLYNDGYQGSTIAGGITAGYKVELNKSLDMDFTLGLGYGRLNFDKYYYCDECKINVIQEANVQKNTIMPIQAGISLIWKIR